MPITSDTKIMVVDDFESMRRIIKNLLRQIGLNNVSDAENGERALELLRKGQFDLVITDWNMPVMNGLDLLKAIRKDDQLKHIPVVMVTAECELQNVKDAAKAGASTYVTKPFTAQVLQEKINKVLK